MKKSRTISALASVCAGALLLAGCSSASDPNSTNSGSGGDVITIKYGSWQPDLPSVTNMWMNFLAKDKELQAKHGISFTNESYTSLDALYTDLAMGRVQGVTAAPSSVAVQAAQGAPVRIASTVARSTAVILSAGKPWSADDLRGARLAAPTNTGTWAEIELGIQEKFGLAPGDYELISSKDLSAALTQVAAGTADYAMTWGENIYKGLKQYPELEIVAQPEDLAKSGIPFWQFSISLHESVSPEGAKRLAEAASEIVTWMGKNPDEVEKLAVEGGQEPGIAQQLLKDIIDSFDFQPMNSEIKKELTTTFDKLVKAGKMSAPAPESVFGKEQ